MKVLEKLTYMVSTANAEVPIILGTKLHDIMELIVKELKDRDLKEDGRSIEFDMHEGWYSNEFYLKLWDTVMQPIIMKYLLRTTPKAWFIRYYEFNYTSM